MRYDSRIFYAVLAIAMFSKAEAQVNLTTGAAEYSIPLYNYSDANSRLGAGIALEYVSGNGLKTNDIPSSVGAGWSLQAGGVIERIQHGLPDDQKRYVEMPYTDMGTLGAFPSGNYVNNYIPNGYLYSEFNASNKVNNGAGYTPLFDYFQVDYLPYPEYMADYEQDVFAFNFNGRVGFFIISKPDQNGNSEIRTLVDSKLKIQMIHGDLNNTNNIRTTISEFRITDESGIVYIFKDAELIQECVYDSGAMFNPDGTPYSGPPYTIIYPGTNPPPNPNLRVVLATTRNAFVKSKWYLSEIVNPLSGQKIVFEYEDYQMDMYGALTAQSEEMDNRYEFSVTKERIAGTNKRLKRIKFSTLEIAEFNYATLPRVDVPMDKALENIEIRYDGQTRFKWEFETGYFVKNAILPASYPFTAADKPWARLCLTKLKRTGVDGSSEPPYEFNYWIGQTGGVPDVVPPLFTFSQDVWGYFNVRNTGFYNPANGTWSMQNPPYAPASGNMLPKSYYQNYTPSHATYGIQFRRPTFEARNGVLKSVRNPLGGTLEYEYEQNYFYSAGQHLYGTGGVRISKISMTDGINAGPVNIKEYKYVLEDGVTTSGWGGSDGQVFEVSSNVHVFKKCGNERFPGIVKAQATVVLHATMHWLGQIGLDFFKSFSFDINAMLKTIIAAIFSELMGPQSVMYSSTSRNSSMYASHNLIPFQYARVEVIDRLGVGNIGKTVYEFTTPNETNTDFAIDFPTLSSPYSSKQRFAFWLYGLPKKTTVFDKDNNTIEKIENLYYPVKYFLTGDRNRSQKWVPNRRTFNCPDYPTTGVGTEQIDHDLYSPICGRVEKYAEKKYVYNSNNEYTETITYFAYSPDNYTLTGVSTYNSKIDVIETKTYYPTDYTLNGVMQTMRDNNMIGVPVSSQTTILKNGTHKYVLDGHVSEFGIAANGDIKAVKSYSTLAVDPIPIAQATFSPNQLLPNANYYKEKSAITYNNDGLPVQVNTEEGSITTLFDHGNKLPVATVINAAIADVAYTSFEADSRGSWTYNNSKVFTDWAPTGKKYLRAVQFDNGTPVVRHLNNPKPYILSFWVRGELPFMTGATYTLKTSYANTATGFTYYEYEVTNAGTITITNLSGGRFGTYRTYDLDELRLYPAEARMRTVTYDPLVGKTAECDENGRITYYEYDGLGRLKLLRDANRNVIKTYEYNYKQ